MLFNKDFLYLDNRAAIALKFVESMRYPSEGEELTVAKLKDDLFLEVVMTSGKEYKISTRSQFEVNDWRLKDEGIEMARSAIFDKWCRILTGKSG